MKYLLQVLRHYKNYKPEIGFNLLFNLLSILFSVVSLAMFAPFLQLIFSNVEPLDVNAVAPEVTFSLNSIIDYCQFKFTHIIHEKGKEAALISICIAILVVFLFKNLFRYFATYFLAAFRNGVVRDIRDEMNSKIIDLPIAYYTAKRKGDIITRVTSDIQEIENSVVQMLENAFRDPITIIIHLGVMIFLSPKLSLFVLCILPITGFIIGRIGKQLKKQSQKGQEKIGGLITVIEETLSGLRIIKAFNVEDQQKGRFSKVNNQNYEIQNRIARRQQLSSPLSEFLGVTVVSVVLWFGGRLVLNADSNLDLTPQSFITFILIFAQIISPAKSFSTAYYNIRKGMASAERVADVLNEENSIEESNNPVEKKMFDHSIVFDHVSFAYDEKKVLSDINLEVKKGKVVALVGHSGAGKSTLVDLIPRFYDTTEGAIIIDGVNIKELYMKDLRDLIGVVTQESILFNDSVFNNIALGIKNVTEADVISAAKMANAHEFITQLEHGYRSNIGDRGGKLSGGQRQRLTIARAILKNPPILILDEATSALDTESEKLVQDALLQLMKDRTTFAIAHRLSTIQHADEILVMDDGEIKERGTHQNLLELNGIYKNLVSLQSFK